MFVLRILNFWLPIAPTGTMEADPTPVTPSSVALNNQMIFLFQNFRKKWDFGKILVENYIQENHLSLPKIRHTACQLSGVSTRFQVYRPCLHMITEQILS